ncbi:UDP-glucose/GDP-mannose dehydrogenase family protein [Rickettsiales bacterium]|nr:UDP-glucose/GDP-mannose dehydrogenase family protein [Rickettsiales bacterium]
MSVKLVVIGTGYVGLVSGACLAEIGHEVICVDKDENKIDILNKGGIPIYEPGLKEVVDRNVSRKKLSFSTNLRDSIKDAEAVLLAVGTPTNAQDNSADLTYVYAAAAEVARNLQNDAVIITKSTVPVGTGQKIKKIIEDNCPDFPCYVASNPEFLREGSAVNDFMQPDRIIIGSDSDKAKALMQRIYEPLIGRGHPILFTNIATAELIKYASNAYLATKIAFANEMSDVCEKVNADVELVIKGMGMDSRIGSQYMSPGPGFGGSCFPKDTLALVDIAQKAQAPMSIVEAVISSNDNRKEKIADKIIAAFDGDIADKNIAILGLTFKANTDDMRYSASLNVIPKLLEEGANIRAYDPAGMDEAKKLLDGNIDWCDDYYSAVNKADAAVILTEWDEFKNIDLNDLEAYLKNNLLIDFRNLFKRSAVEDAGLKYICVGS